MARLPTPGADVDNWGNLLNEYLSAEHNLDGTHKYRGGQSILVAASNAPERLKLVADFVCDGTDDQEQINAALTGLDATGGLVQLSEGTFHVTDAIRMPRRTTLAGKGRATILKAHGTWSAYDDSAPGGMIEPLGDNIDKTHVMMLAIHGNRGDGAEVKGIYYNITSTDGWDESPDAVHVFTDLYIFATADHGYHGMGSRMRGAQLARVRVFNPGNEDDNRAHGFFIEHPDSFFTQCDAGSASGYGFYVNSSNNRFTNCKAWYADLSGWRIRAVRNQFSACESQDNAEHGFHITAGPNTLSACHADNNSYSDADAVDYNQFDGFHLEWSGAVQLIGCQAYNRLGNRPQSQRYGFYLTSGAANNQIIGIAKANFSDGIAGPGVDDASNQIQVITI